MFRSAVFFLLLPAILIQVVGISFQSMAQSAPIDSTRYEIVQRLEDKARDERKAGNYATAVFLLDSAIAICSEFDYKLRQSDILTQKGIVFIYESKYSDALRSLQGGLSIRLSLKDSTRLAKSYNYIAAVHQMQDNFETAASYYKLSYELISKLEGKQRELGTVTNNLGTLYEDQAEYLKSLEYHYQSLDIWKQLQDTSWISLSLNHIGQCYRGLGKLDSALLFLEDAYRINTDWDNRLNLLTVSQSIGLVYLDKNNLKQAENWLEHSYELAVSTNSLVRIQECASSLAKVYELLGKYEDALKFHKIGIELKDSIFGTEMIKEVTQLEMNFQFEKEQLQDSLEYVRNTLIQEKKISNQRIGLFSVGVITIIMIILALVVYWGKQKSDGLLLNILPAAVAEELKDTGASKARSFNDVTVIFTDFKGFTALSEKLSAEELVAELNLCFSAFDEIITKHGIEKIKTIGDAYMAASGLPNSDPNHAIKAIEAALEMVSFVNERKALLDSKDQLGFEMRIGINTGSVIAGIVGTKKFQYDIWGDTVNTAARMESCSEPGRINVSHSTYELIKERYNCTARPVQVVKGKGEMQMYFVEGKI